MQISHFGLLVLALLELFREARSIVSDSSSEPQAHSLCQDRD
jgi:hypothetical protein